MSLIEAVRTNRLDQVKKLLSERANPNEENSETTALIEATTNTSINYDIIKLLLDAGADPNKQNSFHQIPILYVPANRVDIIKLFIEKGVAKSSLTFLLLKYIRDSKSYSSDIITKTCKLLLDNGARLSTGKFTALGIALNFSGTTSIDIIKFLMDNGADPSEAGDIEKSHFTNACFNYIVQGNEIPPLFSMYRPYNRLEVVKLLLKDSRVKLNKRLIEDIRSIQLDNQHNQPLQVQEAIENRKLEIITLINSEMNNRLITPIAAQLKKNNRTRSDYVVLNESRFSSLLKQMLGFSKARTKRRSKRRSKRSKRSKRRSKRRSK